MKAEATSFPTPDVPIVEDGSSPKSETSQDSAGRLHSPGTDRPYPEPAPEPPALRWLHRVHRVSDICWNGARRCVLLAFLIGIPFGVFLHMSGVFLFFLGVAALSGIGYVLMLILHVMLLTFFFSKYSLGQFLTVLMLSGLGVSLAIELEGEWKILPAMGLLALFAIVLIYVCSYDPIRGNRVIPRAAREMLFNPPDAPKPGRSPRIEIGEQSHSP